MIKIKRAYAPAEPADGMRVLVDRLWPRGVRKQDAHLTTWAKVLAPSDGLRQWFGHDPERFREFRTRYRRELAASEARSVLADLVRHARHETVTLVYAASDPAHNNAVVLADELRRRVRQGPGKHTAARKTR